jgi:hypothetical protein
MNAPPPESEGDVQGAITLRWTIVGAISVGGFFAAGSIYRSLASGGIEVSHLNPIAVMTVIGATVGGLIGPLVGMARARIREKRANKP